MSGCARLYQVLFALLSVLVGVTCFNLDIEKPSVYSGPEGSYFGYSVDFYRPNPDKNVYVCIKQTLYHTDGSLPELLRLFELSSLFFVMTACCSSLALMPVLI